MCALTVKQRIQPTYIPRSYWWLFSDLYSTEISVINQQWVSIEQRSQDKEHATEVVKGVISLKRTCLDISDKEPWKWYQAERTPNILKPNRYGFQAVCFIFHGVTLANLLLTSLMNDESNWNFRVWIRNSSNFWETSVFFPCPHQFLCQTHGRGAICSSWSSNIWWVLADRQKDSGWQEFFHRSLVSLWVLTIRQLGFKSSTFSSMFVLVSGCLAFLGKSRVPRSEESSLGLSPVLIKGSSQSTLSLTLSTWVHVLSCINTCIFLEHSSYPWEENVSMMGNGDAQPSLAWKCGILTNNPAIKSTQCRVEMKNDQI